MSVVEIAMEGACLNVQCVTARRNAITAVVRAKKNAPIVVEQDVAKHVMVAKKQHARRVWDEGIVLNATAMEKSPANGVMEAAITRVMMSFQSRQLKKREQFSPIRKSPKCKGLPLKRSSRKRAI